MLGQQQPLLPPRSCNPSARSLERTHLPRADCFTHPPPLLLPAADIPQLQPLGDRVLIKVQESADVTMGGVILPDTAKERPLRCVLGSLTIYL